MHNRLTLGKTSQEEKENTKRFGFTILNEDQISFSTNLGDAIRKNETAKQRIIGLTIETRPDLVTHENAKRWRDFGVTRIEMGVQSTDDEILQLNKRGCNMQEVRNALHILRQRGFKFSLHVMPGLYGSNAEKDLQTFVTLFEDPYLKPDELKIYPTSVIPDTELFELYRSGQYSPITTEGIVSLIKKVFQEVIPPYTRIKRLIRDIPAPEIEAGSSITNLSQLIHESMLKEYTPRFGEDASVDVQKFYARLWENDDLMATSCYTIDGIEPVNSGTFPLSTSRNFVSLDTRSREVRNKNQTTDEEIFLIQREYKSSVGSEFFISFEDRIGYLYGFTRLLLPHAENALEREGLGEKTAIIRELHVYGEQEKIGGKQETTTQHAGLGKRLLGFAEKRAKEN